MRIDDFIEEQAEEDGQYAIAYALLKLAEAHKEMAVHLKYLGNGNAATSMGAIEAFGMVIGEKLDALTSAISERG